MPLVLGRPVRRTVRAQSTGLGQGLCLASVALDASTALGVHWGVMGIRSDGRVAPCLHTVGAPGAVGRGLDQDADWWPCAHNRCEPLAWRLETLRQDRTGCGVGGLAGRIGDPPERAV